METITKNCATCTKQVTAQLWPNCEPKDCRECALKNDAKWRKENAELREETAREMMRQIEPITQ